MNSLCGTTIDNNVLKEGEKAWIWYNLKWNLLRCVITGGGKIYGEGKKGMGVQLYNVSENENV